MPKGWSLSQNNEVRRQACERIHTSMEFLNYVGKREVYVVQYDTDLPPKTATVTRYNPQDGEHLAPEVHNRNAKAGWLKVELVADRMESLAASWGMGFSEEIEASRLTPSPYAADEPGTVLAPATAPPPPPNSADNTGTKPIPTGTKPIPPRPDAAPKAPEPSEANTISLPGGDEIVLL